MAHIAGLIIATGAIARFSIATVTTFPAPQVDLAGGAICPHCLGWAVIAGSPRFPCPSTAAMLAKATDLLGDRS